MIKCNFFMFRPSEVLHEAAEENIQSSAVISPPPYFLCSLSLSCMLNAADRSPGKNASRVISTGELIAHVAYLSSL